VVAQFILKFNFVRVMIIIIKFKMKFIMVKELLMEVIHFIIKN